MSIILATRDDEVVGRCRRAVSAEHPLEVVASAAHLDVRMREVAPAVVILDSEVVEERPLDRAVAPIVSQAGAARVIVMTPVFNEEEEISLLKVGVKGCCRRGIDAESLQQVLNVTQHGGVWVTRSLVPRLVAELRRYAQAPHPPGAASSAVRPPAAKSEDKLKDLTQRERDIVKLIASGATNKQVAQALDISDRTVKGHLSSVFQKLGVPDRLKLMRYMNEDQVSAGAAGKRS